MLWLSDMPKSKWKARKIFGALREPALFAAQPTILFFCLKGTISLRESTLADLFGHIIGINLRGRDLSEHFSEISFRRCC